MEEELIKVRNIGIHLKLDQTTISSLLMLFKASRPENSFEIVIHGSTLIITKLCENFRKIRDILNAICVEIEGSPCTDMPTYLEKKKFLLDAEITLMKFWRFDLRQFRASDYYSLLFSICYWLRLQKWQVQLCWSFFNESFLCERISWRSMENNVAAAVHVALDAIKQHRPEKFFELKVGWMEKFLFCEAEVKEVSAVFSGFMEEVV